MSCCFCGHEYGCIQLIERDIESVLVCSCRNCKEHYTVSLARACPCLEIFSEYIQDGTSLRDADPRTFMIKQYCVNGEFRSCDEYSDNQCSRHTAIKQLQERNEGGFCLDKKRIDLSSHHSDTNDSQPH